MEENKFKCVGCERAISIGEDYRLYDNGRKLCKSCCSIDENIKSNEAKPKSTQELVKEISKNEVRDNIQNEVRDGFKTIIDHLQVLRDMFLDELEVLLENK